MPIHRLSVQLANQIAAGEVVERPASVVKELVENAIDAGAGHITLELSGAGRQAIVVRDNGSGIPRDELTLALEPHATSKIYTLEDLEAVKTMGFRGEALASIAAVSKLTLTSKPKDQDKAYKVHTEGPEMTPIVEPAAHPDGTSVEVRELFFNTPARRRFLRSDKTELSRIKDIMLRIAMAHSTLSFEVVHEGRRLL
ncbi:MAG: ATP-binding protein, partial [Proteobacteria bacterium]|nr:ATP-binding protein [Candidatus Avisuccinivibrio stercorigallinarum]